jgi:NAD(P)-dependent dehydrogenase (short-subunit alcohol dehydrogenase family)
MKTIRELSDLHGRVALITGGAGHIAQAFGEALSELGAEVCVVDISADRAQQRAQQLSEQFGTRTSALGVDVSHEDQVAQMVTRVLAEHDRLDILVNSAAYPPSNDLPEDGVSLSEQRFDQWQAQLGVMLTGTFLATRACAPHLAHGGSVVNIASTYGLVGPVMNLYEGTDMGNSANYAAAKGGIIQLTRYLATTLAPAVRVNCIAPGGVWRNQPESFHRRYCARTPLGRMAIEEDFKGAVAFLASDLSAYVTGQVLAVDGGWTAW